MNVFTKFGTLYIYLSYNSPIIIQPQGAMNIGDQNGYKERLWQSHQTCT